MRGATNAWRFRISLWRDSTTPWRTFSDNFDGFSVQRSHFHNSGFSPRVRHDMCKVAPHKAWHTTSSSPNFRTAEHRTHPLLTAAILKDVQRHRKIPVLHDLLLFSPLYNCSSGQGCHRALRRGRYAAISSDSECLLSAISWSLLYRWRI